jgi:hypothetical protein
MMAGGVKPWRLTTSARGRSASNLCPKACSICEAKRPHRAVVGERLVRQVLATAARASRRRQRPGEVFGWMPLTDFSFSLLCINFEASIHHSRRMFRCSAESATTTEIRSS